MRWPRPHTDPIDAVLGDESLVDDLAEVAAIVHDLRSAYLPDGPLARHPALAAFTDAPLAHDDVVVGAASRPSQRIPSASERPAPPTRTRKERSKMSITLSGFVASVAGKVVLGTAVAAASVGGLHASGVVDVPALPDNDRPAAEQQAPAGHDGAADSSAPAGAAEGQQTAAAKKAAAEAYTDAVREWTDCVGTEAAAQGDEATRTTGGFDPRAGCGEHPEPADFGLTSLPSQAGDAASDGPAATGAAGPTETIPADAAGAAEPPADPGDGPADPPAVSVPTDRDAGVAPPADPAAEGSTSTPGGGRP